MKRIDRLILTSFIPPFIAAFSIALFVLLMQVIWIYIDELAGKGLGMFEVIELLSYRSLDVVPMALPLGMLIASVMTLGNFGERYELSSMKSAGISLMRIMRPLMIFGLIISLFSVYCSNTLIPISNLKFGSRMYDIQQKKPALRLEEGIFNDDFQGFSIHIGKRATNGRNVEGVLIYDHSDRNSGKVAIVSAKEGEMYVTSDGKFFVMQLRDGHQYLQASNTTTARYPFVRTAFEQYTKVFDLSEFELSRTNEELFKQNRRMMSAGQLKAAADSIAQEMDVREKSLSNYLANSLYFLELDSTYLRPDSLNTETEQPADAYTESRYVNVEYVPDQHSMVAREIPSYFIPQLDTVSLRSIKSLIETFAPQERDNLSTTTENLIRSVQNQAEITAGMLERMEIARIKHVFDQHSKFSIALACFIFLFIGAPMGAIIRKGGFGYPILVAILFFMLYVVLTIFCRKIAESFILTPEAAAWFPCGVFMPIGLTLTYSAMNDAPLAIFAGRYWDKLRQWLKRVVPPFSRSTGA